MGKMDHSSWYGFCTGKGVKDPELLTETMVGLGLIKKNDTHIVAV